MSCSIIISCRHKKSTIFSTFFAKNLPVLTRRVNFPYNVLVFFDGKEKVLMNRTLLCQLVVLYFVFSCLGWMMEVTLKYIQYHRFINRGFLIGPYCPIYGAGVVLVTVLVGGLVGIRGGTPGEIFLAGFVICGALEYFISWYMEKAFHARWWDYSRKPMNLNGRIWIGNLILFGLASVVIVLWIDPIYFRIIAKCPPFWLHFAAVAITVLLATDLVVSHVLMDVVRKEIDAQKGDNTEEISQHVHELLRDRNLFIRRIHQAYPELQARPRAMVERVKAARKELKDANRRMKELLGEMADARKNGHRVEELTARLEAAAATLKERRAKLRELERKLLRKEDE